jgi:hypothetical protein
MLIGLKNISKILFWKYLRTQQSGELRRAGLRWAQYSSSKLAKFRDQEPVAARVLTLLKNPALRKKMGELQQQYKSNGGPELGIIMVWNPETGSVGWTTIGVKPGDHNSVGFEDPKIPGWRPIGTIHTHEGSMFPSPDDSSNATNRRLPGVILWGPYYRIYGPPEKDARGRNVSRVGPFNYQNPNPGNQKTR